MKEHDSYIPLFLFSYFLYDKIMIKIYPPHYGKGIKRAERCQGKVFPVTR
jgi:hypothetical protein